MRSVRSWEEELVEVMRSQRVLMIDMASTVVFLGNFQGQKTVALKKMDTSSLDAEEAQGVAHHAQVIQI